MGISLYSSLPLAAICAACALRSYLTIQFPAMHFAPKHGAPASIKPRTARRKRCRTGVLPRHGATPEGWKYTPEQWPILSCNAESDTKFRENMTTSAHSTASMKLSVADGDCTTGPPMKTRAPILLRSSAGAAGVQSEACCVTARCTVLQHLRCLTFGTPSAAPPKLSLRNCGPRGRLHIVIVIEVPRTQFPFRHSLQERCWPGRA